MIRTTLGAKNYKVFVTIPNYLFDNFGNLKLEHLL